jgi:purine-binding chemotaxis protein CheW
MQEAIVHPSQSGFAQAALAREFLAFKLGAEEYGLAIEQIQEIRSYEPVTALANAASHIKGVLNLRGTIIPVSDLRIQFQTGTPVYNDQTVVIVTNINGKLAGFVVDSVTEVVTLSPAQMHDAPDVHSITMRHVVGIGSVDNRMLILVDASNFLTE